jgi:hypothetical protein
MIQERWQQQQQQLAREEAAKLKERVETALAEAIAASSRRCRHRKIGPWAEPSRAADADNNPRDQAVGSYGSQLPNQTQVLQTIPDSVPETPNSAPEANQNLALEPNTLALQARTLLGNQNSFPQTSKTWALVTAAQQQPQQPQQPGEGSPLVPQHQPGGNTLAHQANPIRQLPNSTSKCRKSIQKSTKNF